MAFFPFQKLFKDETYPKPFFSVYFKTSLFALCLFPFLFWRPWHRLCCPQTSLPPNPAPHAQPRSRRSCLKRTQGMWVGGSTPPPSPATGHTSLRRPLAATSTHDSTECVVGVVKAVNAETGQEEVTPAPHFTAASDVATATQPIRSVQLEASPATRIGAGVTIVSACRSAPAHSVLHGKGGCGMGEK